MKNNLTLRRVGFRVIKLQIFVIVTPSWMLGSAIELEVNDIRIPMYQENPWIEKSDFLVVSIGITSVILSRAFKSYKSTNTS